MNDIRDNNYRSGYLFNKALASMQSRVVIKSKNHQPGTLVCHLRTGLGLQALGVKEAIPIEFDCRKADCGICIITVVSGGENLSPPTKVEADFLRAMRADANERLACQVRVLGDVELEIQPF